MSGAHRQTEQLRLGVAGLRVYLWGSSTNVRNLTLSPINTKSTRRAILANKTKHIKPSSTFLLVPIKTLVPPLVLNLVSTIRFRTATVALLSSPELKLPLCISQNTLYFSITVIIFLPQGNRKQHSKTSIDEIAWDFSLKTMIFLRTLSTNCVSFRQ